MKNEVLAKIIAHNLCVLIQGQLELGIAPLFWQEPAAEVPSVATRPALEVVRPAAQAEASRCATIIEA